MQAFPDRKLLGPLIQHNFTFLGKYLTVNMVCTKEKTEL